MIKNEENLVSRIILRQESVKIFCETGLESPAWNDHRSKRVKTRKRTARFAADVSREPEPTQQRLNTKPARNCRKEVVEIHVAEILTKRKVRSAPSLSQ